MNLELGFHWSHCRNSLLSPLIRVWYTRMYDDDEDDDYGSMVNIGYLNV